MFKSKIEYKWVPLAFASLALAFAASSASAVGVDEPEPDEAAITADDGAEPAVGERGPRGRRGIRGERMGGEGFGPPPRDGAEGRRGKRGGRRPGAMLWNRMTEEEREDVRAFVAEYYPEVSASLESAEEDNGKLKLDRKHGRMLPDILRMHKLSIDDPDMFEIKMAEQKSRFELRRLVREYRQSDDDAAKEELSTQIRPLVVAAFDAQQARMEQEVTRLEKRLSGLRDHIAKRAENRDAEIEQAFADVLDGKPPRGERFDRERKRDGRKAGRGRRGPVAIPEPAEPADPEDMEE